MAEEINRRCVDAVADLLFAPSRRSEDTLRRERPHGCVHRVGDVAYDVLRRALPRLPEPSGVGGYDPAWRSQFVYVTLHRAELVDDPDKLAAVMRALSDSPLPCIFPAHPRTRGALDRLGYVPNGRVHLRDPLGYLESVALVRGAAVVVTDSGGVQREAYWLGVPCLTVRDESEWVETIECGANRLVPPAEVQDLARAIGRAAERRASGTAWKPVDYGDGRAAERIAAILEAWPSELPKSSR